MFKTIRSRLFFSFALVFLVTVGLGTVSYFFAQENGKLVDQAVNRDFNGSVQISDLAILAQKIRRYEKEYFMYIGNAEKQAKYEKEWNDTYENIKRKLSAIRQDNSGLWSGRDKYTFRNWAQSLKTYGEGFRDVVANVDAGYLNDTLAANGAVKDAKNAFRVMVSGTTELANEKYQAASKVREQIQIRSAELNQILLAALAIGALLCLALAIIVPRSITRPIRLLSVSASTMSQGQLDEPVPAPRNVRDFSELAATLERMRVSQKAILRRLTTTA